MKRCLMDRILMFFFNFFSFLIFFDLFIFNDLYSEYIFLSWFNLGYYIFLNKYYYDIYDVEYMERNEYYANFLLFSELTIMKIYFFVRVLWLKTYFFDYEFLVIFFLGVISFFFSFDTLDKDLEKSRRFAIIISLISYNIFIEYVTLQKMQLLIMLFVYFGFILKFIYSLFFDFIKKNFRLSVYSYIVFNFFRLAIFIFIFYKKLKFRNGVVGIFYPFILFLFPFFFLKFFFSAHVAVIFILIQYHMLVFIIMCYNFLFSDVEMFIWFLNNYKEIKIINEFVLEFLILEKERKTKKIGYYVYVVAARYLYEFDKNNVVAVFNLEKNKQMLFALKREMEFKEYASTYYNFLMVLTPGVINLTIVQCLIW